MAVSRRQLLHHGVLTALACIARPMFALNRKRTIDGSDEPAEFSIRRPSRSDNWQSYASALDRLGRESFVAAVGTYFKALDEAASQPVWLTLHAVEDLPPVGVVNNASMAVAPRRSSSAAATSGFVLVFGSSAQMSQGTRLFEHDGLGRFALFTVPEGNGGQVYTAVVNRLDQPTIIAAPFAIRQGGGANKRTTLAPAPPSDSVDHSPASSEIKGARRSLLRD